MAQILKLSLPRSLTVALNRKSSLNPDEPLPDLSPVTSQLAHLTPQPGLEECWKTLKDGKANVLVITNGAKKTTQGYIDQAGLGELVDDVRSCDEVGYAKPFAQVYTKAHEACEAVESGEAERWFVAAHLWDLAAARKAGWVVSISRGL
jgi:2-haloacid dehalogenase